ncbi:MAG: DUF2815 family protein [Terrisporobacter sp.]
MSKNINSRKVILGCRFSYLNCFEPHSINGDDPRYGLCAIVPKSDEKTISEINKAIEVAKKESIAKWGFTPENIKTPLRDGDVDFTDNEVYKSCYFFNANSKDAPQVVNCKVQPILDKNEIYSGCYGRISVTFYGYHVDGVYGIAAGLGNIQKIKDGKKLTNRVDAVDEFDMVEAEDFSW